VGLYLGLGHAAQKVRTHVMRLGWRRVVGIAADVQVVIVFAQRGVGHDGTQARHLGKGLEGVDDFLDVLGQQMVLCTAFEAFAVGVDEQDLALALGRFAAVVALPLAHHQHAGRNAGAVEQIGGEADYRFQQVSLNHRGADGALLAAAE
jgi:hypothetical protein